MNILILGAGVDQIHMIKKAKDLGHTVYTCDRNKNALGNKYADYPLDIDLIDVESIRKVIVDNNIQGICTMASNLAPRIVAKIGEEFKLNTIAYQSSLKATEKAVFRELFRNTDIPIAEGGKVYTFEDALKICKAIGFPVLFKPSDGAGCRGIRIVRDNKDIQEKFKFSKSQSDSGIVVVEKYYEDHLVFGVESVVNEGRTYIVGIADKMVKKYPEIGTLGITLPTTLDDKKIQKVKAIVEKIHKKLDIKMGATHLDFVWGDNEPRIIDIGPRLAGGPLIHELLYKLTGFDMIQYVIKQSLGKVENPKIRKIKKAGMSIHFFSPISGRLQDFQMPTLKENMTGVWRKGKGDIIDVNTSNTGRLGYVTCIDDHIEVVREKIKDFILNTSITIVDDHNQLKRITPILKGWVY
ncbi:ATP-grasp domain-containing protein [Crassaminicella profunda]|uniref:ATP-grasp domain-containing protein n=1 Tax=Crassaminicella profunda TaxID=1286698 RepID=UPI001CA799AD|nr:ATP-grasp domain-containing protein [Crassaminicella profunda]QZY56321.1 ATP-grasp domain-containing protein [Crassaminicella profunda]